MGAEARQDQVPRQGARRGRASTTKEMAAMEYGDSSSRKYPAGVNPVDTEVAASWAGPNWINGATDPALGIFVARLVTLGKDRGNGRNKRVYKQKRP